jgi:hypothetical protein
MWTSSGRDLKYRLMMRIVAVSALCFAATWAYFLVDAERSARVRIDTAATIAAKELELQRDKLDWVSGQRSEFPDLRNIATALMAPRLCIAYRTASGDILQRFCSGVQSQDAEPPPVFLTLYRALFDPGREAVRQVLFRGKKLGTPWSGPIRRRSWPTRGTTRAG